MKRIHFITFPDKLKMRSNKNDFSTVVIFADALSKFNAVHIFHFNIKQKNVKCLIFFIFKQKSFSRCKRAYFAIMSCVSTPRCNNRSHIVNLILLIIADCNFKFHGHHRRSDNFVKLYQDINELSTLPKQRCGNKGLRRNHHRRAFRNHVREQQLMMLPFIDLPSNIRIE